MKFSVSLFKFEIVSMVIRPILPDNCRLNWTFLRGRSKSPHQSLKKGSLKKSSLMMVDTWFSAAIIITDVTSSSLLLSVSLSLVSPADYYDILTRTQDAGAINVNTGELSWHRQTAEMRGWDPPMMSGPILWHSRNSMEIVRKSKEESWQLRDPLSRLSAVSAPPGSG